MIATNMKILEELPTTAPKRMYMITPSMVSTEGVKTPPKVPNFFCMFIYSNIYQIKHMSKIYGKKVLIILQ